MVRKVDGTTYGVLNDFDLALDLYGEIGRENEHAQRRDITGTRLFVALDLLEAALIFPHSGRHDMESLYWVVIWYVLRHDKDGPRPANSDGKKVLDNWLTQGDLGAIKRNFLAVGSLQIEPSPAWENAYWEWIVRLSNLHGTAHNALDEVRRNEQILRKTQLKMSSTALIEEKRDLVAARNQLTFKDDAKAWKAFMKILSGGEIQDFSLANEIINYDLVSNIDLYWEVCDLQPRSG